MLGTGCRLCINSVKTVLLISEGNIQLPRTYTRLGLQVRRKAKRKVWGNVRRGFTSRGSAPALWGRHPHRALTFRTSTSL